MRGGLTVYTRFGVMHGKTSGPLSESQKDVMHKLRSSYNMTQHTQGDSDQAEVLTPDFIDEYAIVGTPDRVIEQLRAIEAMGIDKLILSGTRSGVDTDTEESRKLIEAEILPRFRRN